MTYECYGISASAAIGYGSIAFREGPIGGHGPARKLHNPAMMHRNAGNPHDAIPFLLPAYHSTLHTGLKCSVCKSAGFRPIRLFLDRSFLVVRRTCARLCLIAAHIMHSLL